MTQYFEQSEIKDIKTFNVIYNGYNYTFYTDSNVFSKNGLDKATGILLRYINLPSRELKVLDMGCGIGCISIILSREHPEYIVNGVDINKKAVYLAKQTATCIGLNNCSFSYSDCYTNIEEKYDVIITNPPIRAGNDILDEILLGAYKYLKREGTLYFVMSKHQGALSYIKKMSEIYEVEVLKKKKSFYVISCRIKDSNNKNIVLGVI